MDHRNETNPSLHLHMHDLSPLVIVGAGGFGREVASLVEAINNHTPTWDLAGFVDDNETLSGTSVMGYPVRGDVDWLSRQDDLSFSIAIGDGKTRKQIADTLTSSKVQPATLIHPSISLHRTADVGTGTIMCKGTSPTVNLQIGPHVIINLNCTLGHDSVVGSFATLHPGVHISGSAHLEPGVSMGTGSVVLPGVRIEANSTVGAGAVVTENLPENCTAVGVPAHPLS